MNRRKFLKATTAVGLTITIGALAAKEVVKASTLTYTKKATLSTLAYTDDHMDQYLYVTSRMADAEAIHKSMGRPRNVTVVGLGGSLRGYGAGCIIVDDNWDESDVWSRPKKADWFNVSVRTRLVPDGEMVGVKWKAEELDWGSKCGIAAEFRMEDTVQRQAVRHYKPLEDLTHDDYVMSKAKLLEWFIRNRRTRNV